MFFHHENPHEASHGFVKALTLQIFKIFKRQILTSLCWQDAMKDDRRTEHKLCTSRKYKYLCDMYCVLTMYIGMLLFENKIPQLFLVKDMTTTLIFQNIKHFELTQKIFQSLKVGMSVQLSLTGTLPASIPNA